MAVREAVTNAIVHGNQEDEAKKVEKDIAKLGPELDAEFKKTAIPFTPDVFKGRKGKSNRVVVVELFTGLVWAAIVWRIGVHPELPAYLAFATALVILSAIDIEHHRLPNKVLGIASVAGAVLFGGAASVGGRWVNLEHAASAKQALSQ